MVLISFVYSISIVFFGVLESQDRKIIWFAFSGLQDNDDLAVIISPDFVIYKNRLYGEAELLFFAHSILVRCSDISGNTENFDCEWAIADIAHIECHWSNSVSLVYP